MGHEQGVYLSCVSLYLRHQVAPYLHVIVFGNFGAVIYGCVF